MELFVRRAARVDASLFSRTAFVFAAVFVRKGLLRNAPVVLAAAILLILVVHAFFLSPWTATIAQDGYLPKTLPMLRLIAVQDESLHPPRAALRAQADR